MRHRTGMSVKINLDQLSFHMFLMKTKLRPIKIIKSAEIGDNQFHTINLLLQSIKKTLINLNSASSQKESLKQDIPWLAKLERIAQYSSYKV